MSNSVPLVILLTLLAGSRARSWLIVAAIVAVGGLLLWVIGRSETNRIGASLLVFGLITFLIASGLLFERRPLPVAIAVVVGLLYGTTLMAGILPWIGPRHVSWQGHLAGAVGGIVVAYALTRRSSEPSSRVDVPPAAG